MMKWFALVALFLSIQKIWAVEITFDDANSLYTNESYDSAVIAYESLLEENQYSFEIFYNLGNAYFKTNRLGLAILNWEKARKIKPSNQLVIENLNFAYTLARDKFETNIKSVGFIKGFVYEKSPNFWVYMSLLFSVILATTLFLFFVSKNDTLHQISFYVSIVGFVCLIMFVVFAAMHKSHFETSTEAIVLQPRVQVFTEPKEGSEEAFALHEGTKVEVLKIDEEWAEIVVNKDNTGWIKLQSIGQI
ncbi:MAG: hypothetical protein R2799_01660 [Crocinitomicaceae bacterium]